MFPFYETAVYFAKYFDQNSKYSSSCKQTHAIQRVGLGVPALPLHLVLCDAALRDALHDDLFGLVDVLAGGLVERRLRRALLFALPLSRQRLRRGTAACFDFRLAPPPIFSWGVIGRCGRCD
jgi:hypothetical protein